MNRSEPVLQLAIHVALLEKLNKVTNFTANIHKYAVRHALFSVVDPEFELLIFGKYKTPQCIYFLSLLRSSEVTNVTINSIKLIWQVQNSTMHLLALLAEILKSDQCYYK